MMGIAQINKNNNAKKQIIKLTFVIAVPSLEDFAVLIPETNEMILNTVFIEIVKS